MPNMMNAMPGPAGFPGVIPGMQQTMNAPLPNMHAPGMPGNRPQAGDMRGFPPVAMPGGPSMPGGMQANPQVMPGMAMQPNVPQNMMMNPGFSSQAQWNQQQNNGNWMNNGFPRGMGDQFMAPNQMSNMQSRQPMGQGGPGGQMDPKKPMSMVQVVSIDRTLDPPSYCIRLPDGRERETEAYRLEIIRHEELPPDDYESEEEMKPMQPGHAAPVPYGNADANDGAIYYYNTLNGQTTWDKPPGFVDPPVARFAGNAPEPDEDEDDATIGDTGWSQANMSDGSCYYFKETGETTWDVPDEQEGLTGPMKVAEYQQNKSAYQAAMMSNQMLYQGADAMQESGWTGYAMPANIQHDRAFNQAFNAQAEEPEEGESEESAARGGAGQPKQQNKVVDKEEKKRREEEKKKQEEERERLAAERADLARRKAEFKEMLLEKGVVPGSSWEKELPKFCFEPRYKELLDSVVGPWLFDRKTVFASLTRSDVMRYKEKERKKNAALREQALEIFKELLNQPSVTAATTLDSFWEEIQSDERLAILEKTDKKFIKMLTGDTELNHESKWTAYKEKLQEMEKEGKLPSSLSDLDMEDKERLFRDHIKQFHREPPASHGDKANGGQKDSTSDRSDDDAKARGPGEREKQVGDEMWGEPKKNYKKLFLYLVAKSLNAFYELLQDLIKDPSMTWTDAREKLRKNERYHMCAEGFTAIERESMFSDHIESMLDKIGEELERLLDSMEDVTLSSRSTSGSGASLLTSSQLGGGQPEGSNPKGSAERPVQLSASRREQCFKKWRGDFIARTKESLQQKVSEEKAEAIRSMDLTDKESCCRFGGELQDITEWNQLGALGEEQRNEILIAILTDLQGNKKREREDKDEVEVEQKRLRPTEDAIQDKQEEQGEQEHS
ncbi:hypothetical protein GUITHDRAFT_134001 [Guillardia theta CCMP2712]|uniref:WW domain-containing protein n=1 Tax=Guillardia theta (strain CCMP2712) TaxID=905079 RepID=L1JW46_GUITC|nr:hypothetical protein GUITHDRAFT_134001 [Guillardia theta CCMP2712]EKX52303.1 hypothetical protein GUITHDRAFT_134001 [Guillardia theta CCMP2712]|eukprot:XP_005839283.1 hypothetical protein GUITHDRAFT_134001 [Guillardia theta CCMP2712]